MLNSYIKISSSQISNAGREISEQVSAIPGLIQELETALHKLNSCWEGEAWKAFQNNAAIQIEMLTEIYKYMKEFSAKYEKAAEQYRRAEQDVCAKL